MNTPIACPIHGTAWVTTSHDDYYCDKCIECETRAETFWAGGCGVTGCLDCEGGEVVTGSEERDTPKEHTMITPFPTVASAYATDIGEPSLTVVPGVDGTDGAPILDLVITRPLTEDRLEVMLRGYGWKTINVTPIGMVRQLGDWADAGDLWVATVVPLDTDTRCLDCGQRNRWVITEDQQIVCACTIDE